jgi:hypothetical protein
MDGKLTAKLINNRSPKVQATGAELCRSRSVALGNSKRSATMERLNFLQVD